ncbi:MAG: triose-phosphate isomerase [Thermoprotei archaeon]
MPNLVIVNYKLYGEVAGNRGLALALEAKSVSDELGVRFVVAPQIIDTSLYCQARGLTVFAQHCDPGKLPNMTGRVTVHSLVAAGARGVLVNHSEYPQSKNEVSEVIKLSREMGLESCVCVPDMTELKWYADMKPDYIAVEPPELIGGDVSVSKAKPELLEAAFNLIQRTSPSTVPLCGAGIKTSEDVASAKKLGAHGILVSSGFTKSNDPISALASLVSGFFR